MLLLVFGVLTEKTRYSRLAFSLHGSEDLSGRAWLVGGMDGHACVVVCLMRYVLCTASHALRHTGRYLKDGFVTKHASLALDDLVKVARRCCASLC